jgi:hypothetical protein
MPALIGYMVAIVVTLGGYFAGLHWLVSPPDPWQANPKISQSNATPAKKRVAAVKPEPAADAEAAVSSAETKAPVTAVAIEGPATLETAPPQLGDKHIENAKHFENAMARQTERPAAAPARGPEAARAHNARRETPRIETPRIKPPVHKRVAVARNSERRLDERRPDERPLQMMVLRTYERPDGTRFSRLLPMSSARNAMALQLDDGW